jgi:hypothetical protein
MKAEESSWSWARRLSLAGGALLVLLGLIADLFHLGQPGFGERQILLVAGGLLLLLTGLLLKRASAAPEAAPSSPGAGARLATTYRTLAIVLLNALVGLLVLNGVVAAGLHFTDRLGWTRPIDPELGSPLLQIATLRAAHQLADRFVARGSQVLALDDAQLGAIYPGWPRARVAALLEESRGRALRFDPWTQFREKPFRGTFFHIVELGYRLIRDPGPWPMDRAAHNVWVFGGSTTFGYGLPDEQTIPSHLQEALRARYPGVPIHVYNLGQGYFYSAQELALFTSLLTAGPAWSGPPEMAVFVDGINEHQAEPFFTDTLRRLVRSPWASSFSTPAGESLSDGGAIVERWLRNKRAAEGVAQAFGVKTLFVWQPAPDWRYDLRNHPLWWEGMPKPPGSGPVFGSSPHYAAMEKVRSEHPERLGGDLLWLGDLQQGENRPLYVDRLHYTGAFSRQIAEAIAARIEKGP